MPFDESLFSHDDAFDLSWDISSDDVSADLDQEFAPPVHPAGSHRQAADSEDSFASDPLDRAPIIHDAGPVEVYGLGFDYPPLESDGLDSDLLPLDPAGLESDLPPLEDDGFQSVPDMVPPVIQASDQQDIDTLAPADPGGTIYFEDTPSDDDVALRNLEQRRATKRRKRRLRIIAACLVAGALLAVAAWHFLQPGDEPDVGPTTQTAVVERMDFSNSVQASGTLRAGSNVVVTPEVDGVIKKVYVSEGDEVKKGDLLFTLKNDNLDKAEREAERDLEDARAALVSAQNGVAQAQTARDEVWRVYNEEYAKVQAEHDKWKKAQADYDAWAARRDAAEEKNPGDVQSLNPGADPGGTGAAHKKWQAAFNRYMKALDQYEAYTEALNAVGTEPVVGDEPVYPERPDDTTLAEAVESAQEGVTDAQKAVEKAEEAYNEAVADTGKRKVTAPRSGNVVAVGAKVGASVGDGSGDSDGTPLVQIADISKMVINVEVNEVDILSVRKGQKAVATFSAVPGIEATGKVKEVAKVATGDGDFGGVVTFHVGVVLPKPDSQLRPGMTANVEILTDDVPDALVIPIAAISEGTDGTTVEVLVDDQTGETETRVIETGARSSSDVVVESGLYEGETVVYTESMDYGEEY